MTENQRVGGKGIDVWPTRTSDMQSRKRRVVMQHTVKQSTNISLMYTYKLWWSRWIVIQTSCSKKIKIIYKPENRHVNSNDIQQWIHTCKAIRTIMAKIRITMLSETRWAIDTINTLISQTNITMKYRRSSYLWILNQNRSIIIISISMSQMNTISEHAPNDIKNSQCAIKRRVPIDQLIERHVCFILSSSLTL